MGSAGTNSSPNAVQNGSDGMAHAHNSQAKHLATQNIENARRETVIKVCNSSSLDQEADNLSSAFM